MVSFMALYNISTYSQYTEVLIGFYFVSHYFESSYLATKEGEVIRMLSCKWVPKFSYFSCLFLVIKSFFVGTKHFVLEIWHLLNWQFRGQLCFTNTSCSSRVCQKTYKLFKVDHCIKIQKIFPWLFPNAELLW